MKHIKYLEGGSLFKLDNGLYQLHLDSSINDTPWDGSDEIIRPQRIIMSEAIDTNGGQALYGGKFGYWHNKNTGETRIYPVRNVTTKYLRIAPLSPKVTRARQVHDKYVELFWEKPDGTERWSIILSDHGFKTNIRVREGYTGNGEFKWQFELVGLTRQGRNVYDGNTLVGRLPNPFATDGNGDVYGVTEQVVNGVLNTGFDIPANPVFDFNIDPIFGPVGLDRDAHVTENVPTTGFGQNMFTSVRSDTGAIHRTLINRNISVILPGSKVIAVEYKQYYNSFIDTDPVGRTIDMIRMIVPDWEDGNGVDVELNWLNYKNPNVAWPGGSGGLGDTDSTNKVSAVLGSAGAFITWNPVAMVQADIDNSRPFNAMLLFAIEGTGTRYQPLSNSKEHAANNPELIITFQPPSPFSAFHNIIGDRMGSGGPVNVF